MPNHFIKEFMMKMKNGVRKALLPVMMVLGLFMPQQIAASSLVSDIVASVVQGMYSTPQYRDDRPYYFYNNRYYYGGEWRDGYYYYQGRRLDGGHYYRRGYEEHYGRDYKNPNYKNGYYKHNKHYKEEKRYRDERQYRDRYRERDDRDDREYQRHQRHER